MSRENHISEEVLEADIFEHVVSGHGLAGTTGNPVCNLWPSDGCHEKSWSPARISLSPLRVFASERRRVISDHCPDGCCSETLFFRIVLKRICLAEVVQDLFFFLFLSLLNRPLVMK